MVHCEPVLTGLHRKVKEIVLYIKYTVDVCVLFTVKITVILFNNPMVHCEPLFTGSTVLFTVKISVIIFKQSHGALRAGIYGVAP